MAKFITGLDIGTSAVKAAVVEVSRNGGLKLLSLIEYPSDGVKKGSVCHLDEAERAVQAALEKVKSISRGALKNIYVNIGGTKNRTNISRGMVVVSRADNEIYHDDIDRVIKASEDVIRSNNRVVIHTLVRDYTVDGLPHIEDPLGLVGNRLEVESFVIDAFSSDLKNIERVIEKSGSVINGFFYNPISVSRSVLSKNQKDLGVIIIDLGAGTTNLSVYEEGRLLHAATLPIGSSNVTHDIAIGLKLPLEAAEALKLASGFALSKEISIKDKIDLKRFDPESKQTISRKFFSEIIEVRLAEIFELINAELASVGKSKNLPAGAVLVGGGSKLPGLVELAKRELKLPVQLGVISPHIFTPLDDELGERIHNPEFMNCLGLILSGLDLEAKQKVRFTNPWLAFLNYFLP